MEYLILASVGFIAALTPGPDIFYIIRQGLCNGKGAAFWAVFGILTGNIIYLTLVGLGVGIIGKSDIFQAVVGLIGGLYLIKISYSIFRDEPKFNRSCSKQDGLKIFKEALFLNLSNPKAMIFFAIIITPFITKSIMFSLVSLFLGIATAFILSAYISSIIEINTQIMKVINKISAIIFLFFSLSLFQISFRAFKNLL
ncbi:MAG: LysE family translocator [Epsilonproteobacteria bacterium]|nr:LysE family translocator [Campylobacterota bacterium]